MGPSCVPTHYKLLAPETKYETAKNVEETFATVLLAPSPDFVGGLGGWDAKKRRRERQTET